MRSQISCLLLFFVYLGGCDSRSDYIATPFFSEAGFSKIAVGMSEDRVRNLLGYPVSRFGPTGESLGSTRSKIQWNYTVPASCEAPLRYRVFTVEFGPDRLVSGTLACEGSWETHEGVQDSIEAIVRCRRNVGDVILTGFEESTSVLAASDTGLYVILLDADCRAGACQINPGPDWFRDAAPNLLQKGTIAGVKHVYIGEHSDRYRELVKTLAPKAAGECYLRAEPALGFTVRDLDSRMLLYTRGTLWSVPGADSPPNAHLGADDQEWLIQHLGPGV